MSTSATSLKEPTEGPTRKFRYVLVTGGRDYKSDGVIEDAMLSTVKSLGDTIFINGGAKGADTLCCIFCLSNQWPYYCYPAQWSKYGKGKGNPAGPIRNRLMLEMHPDIELVLAFHDFLPYSKGTYDMCEAALEKGIPVLHYNDDGFFQAFNALKDLPPKKEKA